MGDVISCPGCWRAIDVARPPDVTYQIQRAATAEGRSTIVIAIGQVIVHQCVQCPDGTWR